jgi:hypothetical protein
VPARGLNGGSRRCAPYSGEVGAWQRQDAARLAPGEAREGLGWLERLRGLEATWLGSGAHGAAVATAAARLGVLNGARKGAGDRGL